MHEFESGYAECTGLGEQRNSTAGVACHLGRRMNPGHQDTNLANGETAR